MNIVVFVKMVPDLVEELNIDNNGAALDTQWLRLILNEFDDHAIEQAILLKERLGGQVTIIAPEADGVEDALFTASAKGADQLIKLAGETENLNNHAMARSLTSLIPELRPALVLTGVQAHNDLDGQVGPLLAELLKWPYVGYVSSVQESNGKVIVRKEFPGGLLAEIEVTTPAVLGIQASDEPPRYVAFSKVRQAMQATQIKEQRAEIQDVSGGGTVIRMFQPEVGKKASMIEGKPEEVATRVVEILHDQGIL